MFFLTSLGMCDTSCMGWHECLCSQTMIQSYEKSNALYRDHMTSLHNFFESRGLARSTRKSVLAYADALFKARVEGIPESVIISSLPPHLRPPVLMEIHRVLLGSCAFLQECSYSGCADFLSCLDPEVCLKGDTLLRAGTTSDVMYILMRGELQVTYPPEGARIRKITSALGVSAAATNAGGHKQSLRIPQGRVERCGSLVGWQPPFEPMQAYRFTVRALSFTYLFSISRSNFCKLLEKHTLDAPVWCKAVEHANKLLQPSKSSKMSISSKSLCPNQAGVEGLVESRAVMEKERAADDAHKAAIQKGFLPQGHRRAGAVSPVPGAFTSRTAPSEADDITTFDLCSPRPSDLNHRDANGNGYAPTAWMAEREKAEVRTVKFAHAP